MTIDDFLPGGDRQHLAVVIKIVASLRFAENAVHFVVTLLAEVLEIGMIERNERIADIFRRQLGHMVHDKPELLAAALTIPAVCEHPIGDVRIAAALPSF